MSSGVRTTVVVVTWRGRAHVGACLDALAAQEREHRVLVVDNASADGTAAVLATHGSRGVDVLRLPRNAGYAGGIAAALPMIDTPWVAWLNDDACPRPRWLAELEDAIDGRPTVAAAASHLLDSTGCSQSTGVALTADGHGVDLPAERGFDTAVTAECGVHPAVPGERHTQPFGFCGGAALLRVDAVRRVGGVPRGFFCYYEDVDTAWRLRLAGYAVVSVPTARVLHDHGASTVPGSPPFHRWNERNRLLTLFRCAPVAVALRELARFVAITVLLMLRRQPPRSRRPANFAVGLRLRVLAGLLGQLPAAFRTRLTTPLAVSRAGLWRDWAGGDRSLSAQYDRPAT